MSVKAIRLENFMAFADTGWIELRPITLLFGRNSSGKSAIIRALRLLRQTLEQPITQDADERPTLRFNHEYGVALGNYEEAVHRKETERVMRFHFRCYVPAAADMVRQEINWWRQQNDLPSLVATEDDWLMLSLTFGYEAHRGSELVGMEIGCSWQITAEPGTHNLLTAVWLDERVRFEVGYNVWLDTDMPAWQALDWQSANFIFLQNLLPHLDHSPVNTLADALDSLGETIADFLRSIEYLSPIRPEPRRVYVFDDVAREQWRQQGWGAFLDFLEGKLDDQKLVQIDSWLEMLELGKEIAPPARRIIRSGYTSIDEYEDDRVEYDASVAKVERKEKGSRLLINLKNMGYGASQVIPIIVQSVTARQRVLTGSEGQVLRARYVVIEQPELHLHPRAQAQLADLFVDEIYTLPNPLSRDFNLLSYLEDSNSLSNVNFLLETHSEDLLLRLRRRIAETAVKLKNSANLPDCCLLPNNVSMYFVHRPTGEITSSITEIPIGKLGELLVKPEGFAGFFSTDLQELSAITSAQLESIE